METVYDVLRALVTAAFKSGSINDTDHALMHDVINADDPKAVEEQRRAETELSDTERAELERLQAKQQQAQASTAAPDQGPAPDPGPAPSGSPVPVAGAGFFQPGGQDG